MSRTLALALLLALCPATASAASILRFEDFNFGTSVTPGALTALGYGYTDATDAADFTSQLGSHAWDLVILGEQNTAFYGGAMQTALTSYIAGGGRVIAATHVAGPLAQDMGAIARVGVNVALLTGSHAIFAGVGNIALVNPGWSTFSQSYRVGTGPSQCLGVLGFNCGIVLGNGGNTLLLGPLFDTYGDLAQGERLMANSVDLLLGQPQAVPEPSSMILLGTGLAVIAAMRRRRSRGRVNAA